MCYHGRPHQLCLAWEVAGVRAKFRGAAMVLYLVLRQRYAKQVFRDLRSQRVKRAWDARTM